MKKIFNLFTIIILVLLALTVIYNLDKTVELSFWNDSIENYVFQFYIVALAIAVSSFVAGTLWVSASYFEVNDKLKNYKRELEKKSVNSSEKSSQVQVLESKIEVLEKALQNALDK